MDQGAEADDCDFRAIGETGAKRTFVQHQRAAVHIV